MTLTDHKWIKDYIVELELLGVEIDKKEKEHIVAKNINKMIDAFGGAKDEKRNVVSDSKRD